MKKLKELKMFHCQLLPKRLSYPKKDIGKESRLGLNVSDALEVLAIAMGGGKAGQLFEGDRRFDLVVKLPDSLREDSVTHSNFPIPLPATITGDDKKQAHFPYVPLSEIATLNVTEGLNEIRRENGKRFISVYTMFTKAQL